MRKWIILLLILVIGIIAYNYVYQDHRDIENESSTFALTSKTLVREFKDNSSISEAKYLNKTIEVSGTITQFSDQTVTLDDAIFCQLINQSINTNKTVTVKGRFIGYDDLLEQLKLDQCTIIN